jgi:hypothetical protein
MQVHNSKFLRLSTKWFLALLGIYLLLIAAASPLARSLIEKHDVAYTGREISIGRALVNPLAGTLCLKNLVVYELGNDSIFMSGRKFRVNLSLVKLISGVYELSSLKLNDPVINIIREDTVFNFNDIIIKFSVETEEEILKLNIRNIEIKNGIVYYREDDIPGNLTLSEVYFKSKGVFWNVDSITGSLSLVPEKGFVSGNFMFGKEGLDYHVDISISEFALGLFEPYVDKMAGEANLTGIVNLDLIASGNLNQLMKGKARGSFELNDFHIGPGEGMDYISINRLLFQFREINLTDHRFVLDSVLLDKPSILYQLYDTLDNYRRMFYSLQARDLTASGEEGEDTDKFLKSIGEADYYIHSFSVNDATIEFEDYSISEKFSIAADNFNIKADTIDKQNRRVVAVLEGDIRPYGRFDARLSMDPENEENFDFKYEIRNVAASTFNPYLLTYSSHILDHGTIEMHGKWSVRASDINGQNHFIVINPQNTKKIREKDKGWIPVPLILAFVRERGSVIDYDIPVEGNLDDPEFVFCDVITDILRNIVVKPPTTPYRLEVRNAENKIEKTLNVRWKMGQSSIDDEQGRFMKNVARFLKNNPEARIVVQPVFYEEKEKETILIFEARKRYFLQSSDKQANTLTRPDSIKVEKIPVRDTEFMQFLNNSVKGHELLTIQEKCYRLLGREPVNQKYAILVEERKKAFMEYFEDLEDRVEILDIINTQPYNWLSYYDINYKGDIPESLSEAFNKLYEFNTQPPRDEYFEPPRRR